MSKTFSICKGKNALKFRCQNSHTFFVGANLIDTIPSSILLTAKNSANTAAISDDCWCYKCKKFYETCQEVAAQVGLSVVEGIYST